MVQRNEDSARTAQISRKTNETKIDLKVDLDGTAEGDLHVDQHHTVEDVGIVLGQAIEKALGDKRGIHRYGSATVPMDESLATVTVDLSGRPAFVFNVKFTGGAIGSFDVELVEEFLKALATS